MVSANCVIFEFFHMPGNSVIYVEKTFGQEPEPCGTYPTLEITFDKDSILDGHILLSPSEILQQNVRIARLCPFAGQLSVTNLRCTVSKAFFKTIKTQLLINVLSKGRLAPSMVSSYVCIMLAFSLNTDWLNDKNIIRFKKFTYLS